MAATRTAAPPRARRRPAARHRPGPRTGASRIQWDRVGRVALCLVLAAVFYSYLHPLHDLMTTYTATSEAKAKLHEVLDENKQLHWRVQHADDPVVLDAKARAQGMVRPGETPLVIRPASR